MPRRSWGAFKVKGILIGLKDKRAACDIVNLSPDTRVTRQRYGRDRAPPASTVLKRPTSGVHCFR